MARPIRPHAPGHGFHITARLQNGVGLFTPDLQESVAWLICEAAMFCGTSVLALTVMPNHFHIVVKQGPHPLGWMMQRAMQQTARLVRQTHGGEGHVFGRRYWASICPSPYYLRQAIIYTHLNPWKAELCNEPWEYAGCSDALIVGRRHDYRWSALIARDKARALFAGKSLDEASVAENYKAYIAYWKFRYKRAQPNDNILLCEPDDPERPVAPLGDQHWAVNYIGAHQEKQSTRKHDICERAAVILNSLDPECSLDVMRLAGRSAAITGLRRKLVAALLTAGDRNRDIARCLYVSPALVSAVAANLRLDRSAAIDGSPAA